MQSSNECDSILIFEKVFQNKNVSVILIWQIQLLHALRMSVLRIICSTKTGLGLG